MFDKTILPADYSDANTDLPDDRGSKNVEPSRPYSTADFPVCSRIRM
jgi:hypothetical protein